MILAQLDQTMSYGVCADITGEALSTATFSACIGRDSSVEHIFTGMSITRSRSAALSASIFFEVRGLDEGRGHRGRSKAGVWSR